MPEFSGMVTVYIYVLFASLLFVAILAVARSLGGADVFHRDVGIDHGTEIGTVGENTRVEIGGHEVESSTAGMGRTETIGVTQETVHLSGSPIEPATQPGLLKFRGMTLMTTSIFLVSFAAMGILSLYYVVGPYNLDPLTSIPIAGGSSAALALVLSYASFKYFVATAAGGEMSLWEVVGRPCEVTVGTSGEGWGEVNCRVKGQTMSFSARSLDGSRLSVGDTAQIVRMTGNMAVVSKRLNQ